MAVQCHTGALHCRYLLCSFAMEPWPAALCIPQCRIDRPSASILTGLFLTSPPRPPPSFRFMPLSNQIRWLRSGFAPSIVNNLNLSRYPPSRRSISPQPAHCCLSPLVNCCFVQSLHFHSPHQIVGATPPPFPVHCPCRHFIIQRWRRPRARGGG